MNEHTASSSDHAVADAIASVNADIKRFCERYDRDPGSVELLAVSKTKPVSAIEAAISAGQRSFGENYVDEAVGKMAELASAAASKTLVWHYIGAIQSRRCELIAEHFDWAHGVDRAKIARRLSERRPDSIGPLNVCIQLNPDGEASKAGVAPDELHALAEMCETLPGIQLRGLMTIPAPRDTIDEQRKVFAVVREQFDALRARGHERLDTLSMGMSGDLEAAIAEGATIVRVGTALFGARATPHPSSDSALSGS